MPTIVHKHEPEIRVITGPAGVKQHKVLYVRQGEDDVDLTDLFLILGIKRDVVPGELAKVELAVLARLVEVCE